MKVFLSAIFIFIAAWAYAEKGTVIFRIAPTDAIIKVDGQYYKPFEPYIFETGLYQVEAWSPHHEYVKLEFEVKPHETNYVSFGLNLSREFQDYKHDLNVYRFVKISTSFALPFVCAGEIARNVIVLNKKQQHINVEYDRSLNYYSLYNNAVNQNDIKDAEALYDDSKANYESLVSDYKKYKRNMYLKGAGFVAVNAGILYLTSKLKKPVFNETIKLSMVQESRGFSNYAMLQLNLRLP